MPSVDISAKTDYAIRALLSLADAAQDGSAPVSVDTLAQRQHLLAVFIRNKLALVVEQFQRVPLLGVVRGREDDAAARVFSRHGHLYSRRGAQAQVDNMNAQALQRGRNQPAHHIAREAGVAADNDGVVLRLLKHPGAEGSGVFYHVDGRQAFAGRAANGAPDAGNRFDKCLGKCC